MILSFFSSFWCRGLAAVCDCGIPWTFLLTCLHLTPVVFVQCGKPEKRPEKVSPYIHLMALLFQVPWYALYDHFSHSLPLNTLLYRVEGQVLTGIRIPFKQLLTLCFLELVAHRQVNERYDRKRPQEVNPLPTHNASLTLRMCAHGRRQLSAFDWRTSYWV